MLGSSVPLLVCCDADVAAAHGVVPVVCPGGLQDSIRALTWLRSRIFKPPQSLSGAPARGGAHVVPGA